MCSYEDAGITQDNIAIAGMNKYALGNFLILDNRENAYVDEQIKTLSIKCPSRNQLTSQLSGIQNAITTGFANAEMSNFQGYSNISSQLAQCCCENRLATANLGSDIAREACATRTSDTQNTQTLLNAITGGIQSIKDQMCNDKIDAKNEKIADLERQLSSAQNNAFLTKGFSDEVDALYNRLSNCPVPSMPVYGRTPIFTCNSNNSCGCGCGMG